MNDFMAGLVDVNGPQGHAIAAAMREVAEVDGIQAGEIELLRRFESGLEPLKEEIDVSVINTPALRNAYVQSMVIVAFADGSLSELERETVTRLAEAVGIGTSQLAGIYTEVARNLLASVAGVDVPPEMVTQIGQQLGLYDREIQEVLGHPK